MVKPVVPPEEYFADYKPNCYELIKEIVYEDELNNSTHEVGVGGEPLPDSSPQMAYNVSNVSRDSAHIPTHDHSAPPPPLADSSGSGPGRESVPLAINSPTGRR